MNCGSRERCVDDLLDAEVFEAIPQPAEAASFPRLEPLRGPIGRIRPTERLPYLDDRALQFFERRFKFGDDGFGAVDQIRVDELVHDRRSS